MSLLMEPVNRRQVPHGTVASGQWNTFCSAPKRVRSSRFSSLPLGFFGNASTKNTCLGVLYPARWVRQWVDQLVGGQGGAVASDHGRHHGLDPHRMRDSEYRHFLHGGVPIEHLFDLAACDVLATGLDHVLLAVHDMQEPELVVVAEVSGMKPPAAERFSGARWIVEVAQHQVRATVGDLADGPCGTGVSVSSRIAVSTLMAGRPAAPAWSRCSAGPSALANGAISVCP